MNLRRRIGISILSVGVLSCLLTCQKKQAPEQSISFEHMESSPSGTQTILQKSFTVRTSVAFPFEIPAHAALPRLRGNYKSFVTTMGIQSNPDAANVELQVMTDEQYADFVRGSGSEVLFSAGPAHDENINVNLPPSMSDTRKYYLVFRNPGGGDAKKAVQADLSIDF